MILKNVNIVCLAFPSKVTPSSKAGKEAVMLGFDRNESTFRRHSGGGGCSPSPDWV